MAPNPGASTDYPNNIFLDYTFSKENNHFFHIFSNVKAKFAALFQINYLGDASCIPLLF